MYPLHHFSLFPPFPRAHRVFVAMSFAEQFEWRWNEVIAPAISAVEIDGHALKPHRVDTRSVNDSILTEILEGISTDLLVFADVTAMGSLGDYAVRNGNVLYEVGLAHAVRLPEEVLMFRSDNARLLFDVASIRVTTYDPDGEPDKARVDVSSAIANALCEIRLRRHKAVDVAAHAIGFEGFFLLARCSSGLGHPIIRTVHDLMKGLRRHNEIPRLLDMGLIKSVHADCMSEALLADPKGPAERVFSYETTTFGEAVLGRSLELMGINEDTLERLQAYVEQSGDGS